MADDDADDPVRAERERELQKFNAPYVYQEYPRMLYRAATDSSRRIENHTVQNADEEQQAQAAGWLRGPDLAVAAEQARQEASAAERKAQETRELEDVFRRVLEEREKRQEQPLRKTKRSSIPSFGQQLTQAMDDARVSVDWLVAELAAAGTPIDRRTVERLKADERNPRVDTVRALEGALTKARNGDPMRFLSPFARRQRRKSTSPRKRSQKAAKRP